MTTFTIFAETSDGRISSLSPTYSIARAGSGALVTVDNGKQGTFMGNQFSSGLNRYTVFEGFFDFDTSAIPGADTIDSATVSLHGTLVPVTGDPLNAEMRIKDWGPTLTNSDFVPGASLSSFTRIALFNAGNWVIEAYNDFTSDAAFLTQIVPGGNTRMFVSSSATRQNITPTGFDRLECFFADEPGTTQDPKLVVETTSNPVDVSIALSVPIQSLTLALEAATTADIAIGVPIQTMAVHIDINEAKDVSINIDVPIQTLALAATVAEPVTININVPIQTIAAAVEVAHDAAIAIEVPIQSIDAHIDVNLANDVTVNINVPIQTISMVLDKKVEAAITLDVPIQSLDAHIDVNEAIDLTANINVPLQSMNMAIDKSLGMTISMAVPLQSLNLALENVPKVLDIAISVPLQTLRINGAFGSRGELSSMSPIAEVIAAIETGPVGLQSAFLGTPVDL